MPHLRHVQQSERLRVLAKIPYVPATQILTSVAHASVDIDVDKSKL